MDRRTLLTTMTGGMVAVTGCSGGGGDGDDGSSLIGEDGDGDDDGDEEGADGIGGGDADEEDTVEGGDEMDSHDELESTTWNAFDFQGEARYEYEFFMREEGEGTLVWDVREVDEETVTVHVEYDDGENEYESTVTGDRETVQGDLMMTPAGGVILMAVFSPMFGGFEGEELEVGTEWSHSSPEGSARYAVTGTDTRAGVSCYSTVIEVDEETVHEGCLNPELGLSVYSAFYEEGELEFEIELVSYDSG